MFSATNISAYCAFVCGIYGILYDGANKLKNILCQKNKIKTVFYGDASTNMNMNVKENHTTHYRSIEAKPYHPL